MEFWEDQGIVLSVRSHGENGAVVSLLTEEHGRHSGYVHGAHSSRMRALLQPGSLVNVDWKSRISENLGAYKLEQLRDYTSGITSDPLKLSALLSACSLCDAALPEREAHPGMFHGFLALLDNLGSEVWAPAYVYWEIALLRELGFTLELDKCAGGGKPADLAYVSPKTGRAVSAEKGEPYKDKLLPLPSFLKPGGNDGGLDEVLSGLRMSGYFLEHWVFAHTYGGVPESRRTFQERLARKVEEAQAA